MKRNRYAALAVLLCALLLAALLAQGCGTKSGTTAKNGTTVLPDSNATAPQSSATKPSDTTKTTPTDTEKKTTPSTTPSSGSDAAAASKAAASGAHANNPSLGELEVLDVKIVGDWARVDMQPVDKSTDAASALLQKVNGTWKFVALDSMLVPENYPDAPASLFQ